MDTELLYSEETEHGSFRAMRDEDGIEVVHYSHESGVTARISHTETTIDLSGIQAVLDLVEPLCNFVAVAMNGSEFYVAAGLVYYSMTLDRNFIQASERHFEATGLDVVWLWSTGDGWAEVIYASDKPN